MEDKKRSAAPRAFDDAAQTGAQLFCVDRLRRVFHVHLKMNLVPNQVKQFLQRADVPVRGQSILVTAAARRVDDISLGSGRRGDLLQPPRQKRGTENSGRSATGAAATGVVRRMEVALRGLAL